MLRKKFFIKILAINLVFFCTANFVSAQKTTVDKNALAKFEKSIEKGNYSEIERELLDYAIQNPTDAKGFELLGRLRFAQNRLNEAKSLYQKALSLDPKFTSAKIDLAAINFQTGNPAQANSDLNEISESEISDDLTRLKLAQTFALVGNCRNALNAIEKIELKIKNNNALPLRAQCYFETGEKQKIESLIPPVKNQIKQNPAVAVKFTDILINGGMFKESADVLLSVVKMFPQNADALILLAKSEIYLKDFANAKIHLAQASKINNQSKELFFVQALFAGEQGKNSESLELLEKSLAAEPNSRAILKQYVITAMRANQNGKAVKVAERLLELKPDEPEFLYLYGAASLRNNNLRTAESSLEKFIEIRPNDSLGCFALGLTYAAQPDKLEIARRQMEKCIVIDPKNFEAKYQLGLSYKAQGETAKATDYLEQTVKDSPDYALALRDLGAVYLQSGAETKARTVLEKSVVINPNDADTHFQLSRLYNLIGETELAKKHLEIFQKLRNPKKDGM